MVGTGQCREEESGKGSPSVVETRLRLGLDLTLGEMTTVGLRTSRRSPNPHLAIR